MEETRLIRIESVRNLIKETAKKIDEKKKKKRLNVDFRLEKDMYEFIEKIAKKDLRTPHNWVRVTIMREIERLLNENKDK